MPPSEDSPYHQVETPRATRASKPALPCTPQGKTHNTTHKWPQDDPTVRPSSSFHFPTVYRYATRRDKALLVVGLVATGAYGAVFPMMAIVFGHVLTGFEATPVALDHVTHAAREYLTLAVFLFVTDYVAYVAFQSSAATQIHRVRVAALEHLVYMDMSWYDAHEALQLASRVIGDTVRIKDGMGQHLSDACRFSVQFVVGVLIGVAHGWDLTLVMACVMPVLALSLSYLIQTIRVKSEWAQQVYAEAGSMAEDTIASMRTVASLTAEHQALSSFNHKVTEAETENLALHKITAAVFAMFLGSLWVMYAMGLWYGGWKASRGHTTPQDVFAAFFAVLMGASSLAQISPNVTAVSKAAGAADQLFAMMDTPSAINAADDAHGIRPATCHGRLEAVGLSFAYPSRPNLLVLRDYHVTIEPGETVAFVGPSGGGKSTLVALLERFYDPLSGTIYLDGRDLKTLNVKWLRAQIGLVSQEPVLFATTIAENVTLGGRGEHVTRDDVIAACKWAHAHAFIMSFPDQYDTIVGENGVSLSGGQKQRLALARAIVRKPSILVLDEATSALDNESERMVQAALNDLMAETTMTTLVIAHRLSTIRHADKILVVQEGEIVERGTHDELVHMEHGLYQHMYRIQQLGAQEDAVDSDAIKHDTRARPLCDVNTGSEKVEIAPTAVEQNVLMKQPFGLRDILRLSWLEGKHFVLGLVATLVGGISVPLSGLLVSGMIASMAEQFGAYKRSGNRAHLSTLYHDVELYGILYLVGAAVVALAAFGQSYCFKYIEEKTTRLLRSLNFESLCRQNIGFFDDQAHATGALTADLATHPTHVACMTGESQARAFQAVFTLAAALGISFGFGSWLLSLLMLGLIPFLLFGHVMRTRQMHGAALVSDDLALPGAHASEVLSHMRTVAALGMEEKAVQVFANLLAEPLRAGRREAQVNAVSMAFSSFILMATYALVFWVGAHKVNDGSISFSAMMRTLMAITMSIHVMSFASTFFLEAPRAFQAGASIYALRDRIAPIDSFRTDGLRLAKVHGQVEFRNVYFRYPRRPEVDVLENFTLSIEPGETVAFIGPSGSGKSTIVALLERFYDPILGEVRLDGHNLKSLNVTWLRRQLGLVSQEPTLFMGTIADNIAYGLAEPPSAHEIETAAKMANAHDFIRHFPDGYKTQVGMKGDQLSGGQKQRIAIARAIVKKPAILLLDEATSALDTESEQVVQEALDKVMAIERRTTLVIAHRLSTIRRADKICVVKSGTIAEVGTHDELLARNGMYTNLHPIPRARQKWAFQPTFNKARPTKYDPPVAKMYEFIFWTSPIYSGAYRQHSMTLNFYASLSISTVKYYGANR
ncbi:hypothetical protein PsorP6_015947 [Peronosclerospora sorghi]|uniref:Uncharacterized protein n=1 Tax=Peronosclerospora sorghi TaxID=230839 RepID=A0ACC0WNA3_9STRA|nr:hypothetical protein PsorP6_015947 [Peronosclerospora sorghi]